MENLLPSVGFVVLIQISCLDGGDTTMAYASSWHLLFSFFFPAQIGMALELFYCTTNACTCCSYNYETYWTASLWQKGARVGLLCGKCVLFLLLVLSSAKDARPPFFFVILNDRFFSINDWDRHGRFSSEGNHEKFMSH